MSDFWDNFLEKGGMQATASTLDHFLSDEQDEEDAESIFSPDNRIAPQGLEDPHFTSMQGLVKKKKSVSAKVGTRVKLRHCPEVWLNYPILPNMEESGSVVLVRTASGDTTIHDNHLFIKWDYGGFGAYHLDDLRPSFESTRRASSVRQRIAGFGDLTHFFEASRTASTSTDLIHKSTRDLWSLEKEGDNFVLSRLFTDSGEPLKAA